MTAADVPARPLPVPDEVSAPFWAAAREHRFTVARCSRCGRLVVAPPSACPECGAADPGFTFDTASGWGRLRSWCVVRQSFLPGLDVPFTLVDVELDDQPDLRVIGRLAGSRADPSADPNVDLAVGAPVIVVFDDVTPEVSVPAFALALESGGGGGS